MTNDDELRSRIARLAATHDLGDLTADEVIARGRRGAVRHRVLAVAAVLLLVVAVAGVIRLAADDDTTPAEVASGGDADDEPTPTSTTVAPTTTTGSPGVGSDDASAVDPSYSGGDWVLPWGDGFVRLGQVLEPSDATMQDLVPDLADRLPAEVIDALGDLTDIDEAVARLEEVDLLDEATAAVTADPELLAAYNQVQAGGTFRFEASVSTDGTNWTVLDDFTLPGGAGNLSFAQSDGAHLVVVEQQWQVDATSSGPVVVSATDDLVEWTSVTVPVELAQVPDYAQAGAYPESLAVGPAGWYLTVSTSTWIDLWSMVPEEIQAEFGEQGWWPEADGLHIESYDPENGGETPADSRVVPWSELGITYADYQRYGESGAVGTTAFTGAWDGSSAVATPPGAAGWSSVIGTDAGFVALRWPREDISRSSSAPREATLHFSPDGTRWDDIDGPSDAEGIQQLVAVDGGVIATDGAGTVWRAAADGTGWASVEIPDLPVGAGLWFGPQSGRGMAAVLDIAIRDHQDEQVPYTAVLEHDGYEIRTATASDGSVRVVVTEIATGTVRIDEFVDPLRSSTPDFIRYPGAGDTIELLDPDGEVVVVVPVTIFSAAQDAAIEEARVELGWVEPEYDYTPDFWLVATFDGVTWLVEDLDDAIEDDGFGAAAAVNGEIVVVGRWGGGGETFTIG